MGVCWPSGRGQLRGFIAECAVARGATWLPCRGLCASSGGVAGRPGAGRDRRSSRPELRSRYCEATLFDWAFGGTGSRVEGLDLGCRGAAMSVWLAAEAGVLGGVAGRATRRVVAVQGVRISGPVLKCASRRSDGRVGGGVTVTPGRTFTSRGGWRSSGFTHRAIERQPRCSSIPAATTCPRRAAAWRAPSW